MALNTKTSQLPGVNLVYIIGTYPLLTTTFIDREIAGLLRKGVSIKILSIRKPSNPMTMVQKEILKHVQYLLPASLKDLIKSHLSYGIGRNSKTFFSTFIYLVTRPHPNVKSRLKTLLHFSEGVLAAYVLRNTPCDHIHAHFVDRAAIVALVVSRFRGVPYSVTAHANDIYAKPVLLAEKLDAARDIITCTGYNKKYLAQIVENGARNKLHCIYHGLDFNEFQPGQSSLAGKPVITAVGQLKEKKGYPYLLKACRILKDKGYDFECHIIGAGPMLGEIMAQRHELALDDTVVLMGMLPHKQVIEHYKQTTIFVLPCVIGSDGDRDGIPNVILEAMAMKLPVISTQHSGIPEVVENDINGLLVPPADEIALAEAIAKLLDNPKLREQFGEQGREVVIEKFDLDNNVNFLLSHFNFR